MIAELVGGDGTPLSGSGPDAFAREHGLPFRRIEDWAQVADGTRAVTTADTYRQRLRAVVLPDLLAAAGSQAPTRPLTRTLGILPACSLISSDRTRQGDLCRVPARRDHRSATS